MVTKSVNRPGKAVIRKKLKRRSVGEISEILEVDPAHIYNVERRGVSPTLHDALIDAGWVKARGKRYRLHYNCGRGAPGRERDAEIRRAIAAAGCESFTEWVDNLREVNDG